MISSSNNHWISKNIRNQALVMSLPEQVAGNHRFIFNRITMKKNLRFLRTTVTVVLMTFLTLCAEKTFAQVANYSFSQTNGNTYSSIAGTGTALSTAKWDDNVYTTTLPFSFVFNGTTYASGATIYVNSNGYITFGATSSSTSDDAISATTAYAGAASGIGCDLASDADYFPSGQTFRSTFSSGSTTITYVSGTYPQVGSTISGTGITAGTTVTAVTATTITLSAITTHAETNETVTFTSPTSIIYTETIGSSPNQQFVIEWINSDAFNDNNGNLSESNLNFQIVLSQTTNNINVNFGTCTPGYNTTISPQPAIGLRGTSNADYNDRTGSTWATSTAGGSNAALMTLSTSAFPASGLDYVWAPPAPCTAPTAQPTILNLSSTATTSITGSFTAASPAPSGYLVVYSTSSTLSSNPVNGTTYAAGNSLGGGTVVQVGTSTTFTATGLTANTQYYFFIFSYASGSSCSISYLTTSPLTANGYTECAAPTHQPTALTFPNNTSTSIGGSFTAATGSPNGYLVVVSTSSTLSSNPVNGTTYTAGGALGGGTVVQESNATTFIYSPASANTLYYFFIFSYNSTTCYGGPLYYTTTPLTGSSYTSCSAPTAQATSLSFSANTSTTITGSFTAASPAPSGYIVIATLNSTLSANPANGTTYTTGGSLGGGTIIQSGTSTSISATGLTPNSTYNFFVFSYNNTTCSGGPIYLTASPLTGNYQTCVATPTSQPTALSFPSNTATSIGGSFTAASGAPSGYVVVVSTSASLGATPTNGTAYTAGSTIGSGTVVQASNATTFNYSPATAGTEYYFFIFSYNTGNCTIAYDVTSPLTGNSYTACSSPTTQPTVLILSSTSSTSIAGSFTAASPAPTGYIIVRSTSATLSSNPVNGTTYTAGGALGGGTVVQVGATTTFTATGLTANTQYYFFIFSYNNTTCSGGPDYLTSSPLTGNGYTECTTPTSQPTALTFPNNTATSIGGSFTAASGAPSGYLVVVSTSSSLGTTPTNGAAYTAGSTIGSGTVVQASNATTFTYSPAIAGTEYYFFIFSYISTSTCYGGPIYDVTSPLTGNSYTACTAPNSVTGLSALSSTTTTISGTIGAPSPAPSAYVVFFSTSATAPSPVNGTTYAQGTTYFTSYVAGYVGTSTSFTSTALASNTNYYLYVFAYNNTTCSGGPAYSPVLFSNFYTCINVPTALTAGSIGNNSATLGWTAPAGTITSYTLQYEVTGTGAGGWVTVTGITSNSYPLSGLSENTSYTFEVLANNTANTSTCGNASVYSSTQTFITTCSTPTAQATGLTFGTVNSSSIAGSFTAASPAPYGGYLVVYSTSATLSSNPVNGTTYSAGGSLGGGKVLQVGSSTSFTATGLSVGTTYYFFVFSYNSGVCTNGPVYLTTSPLTGSQATVDGTLSTDIFRSYSGNITNNGEWSTASNWQSEHSVSGTWITATSAPGASAASITINNGDAIAVGTASNTNESITAENTTVNGNLTTNAGSTFTINHTGTSDLTISNTGTLTNSGTVTRATSAAIVFASGSNYIHAEDGGTVPTATWNAASTATITGTVLTVPSGLGQTFGILTWNAASQTANVAMDGEIPTISSSLNIVNTNSGSLSIANTTAGTMTITGSFNLSGGNFYVGNGSVANTMTINGTVNITGGNFAPDGTSGTGAHTVNVTGNWTLNSPGIYSPGSENVNFDATSSGAIQTIGGTGTSNFDNLTISTTSTGSGYTILASNIEANTNMTVAANSTFDLSTYTANNVSGGNLTLNAGSILKLAGTTGGANTPGNNFPANYITYALNSISTVSYYGPNQTIYNAVNYGNITMSNNGSGLATKSITASISGIANNVTVNNNTSFDLGRYAANCTGNTIAISPSDSTIVNYNFNSGTSFTTLTNSGVDPGVTSTIGTTSTASNAVFNSSSSISTATESHAFTLNPTAGNSIYVKPTNSFGIPGFPRNPGGSPTGLQDTVTSNTNWIFKLSGSDLPNYGSFNIYLQYYQDNAINIGGDLDIFYKVNGAGPWIEVQDVGMPSSTTWGYTVLSNISGGTSLLGSSQLWILIVVNAKTNANGNVYIDNFQVQGIIPGSSSTSYGTLTLNSGSLLRLGGTAGTTNSSLGTANNFPGKFTYSVNANSTVEYYGNTGSTQQIYAGATYGNLHLMNYSGSGIANKTTTTNISGIQGSVAIYDSTHLDISLYALNAISGSTGSFSMTGTNGYGYIRMSGTSGGIGTSNFPLNFSSYSLGAATTQEFYGSGQIVPLIPGTSQSGSGGILTGTGGYGNLTITGTASSAGSQNIQSSMLINTGATFTAGANSYTVGAGWTTSGGFTAGTSTVVFDGTGSVTNALNPGTSSFYTLNNNSSSATTLQLTSHALTTTNTFTNASGVFDALTNNLAHTVTNLATVSGGNYLASGTGVTHTFNGGLTVSGGTFTGNAGNVTTTNVALSSGTLIAPSGLFTVTGNWAQSGGSFTPGTYTVTFTKTSGTQTISTGSGGTAVSNSAFNNIDHTGAGVTQIINAPVTTGGTFTNEAAAGNFDANGQGHTVTGLASLLGASYLPNTGQQTFNGGLTVNGGTFNGLINSQVSAANVTLTTGTLTDPGSTGTFTVSGNWSKTGGTFTPNSGTVNFNGTGSQTLNSGGAPFYNILITAGSSVTLITNNLTTSGTFTHQSATFNANALTHTVTGLATVSGGTYLASTNTQTFNGGLTVSGGDFTGSTGNVSSTNVILSSGLLTSPSGLFTVTGNWAQSGGDFTPGTYTVTFASTTGTQTISTGSGGTAVPSSDFNNIDHTGAGILQIINARLATDGTFTNEAAAGNFDANGNAHTVTGLAALLGGSYLPNSGQQTFNGGLVINGGNFNGITNSQVSASNVTITTGTLTAPGSSGTFTVSGNWAYNGGTFTNNSGTVSLNGSSTQIIGGALSSTFGGLTLNNSSNATLVDASNTGINKTVTGVLTLTSGYLTTDASDLLIMTSTSNSALGTPSVSSSYYTGGFVNGPIQKTGNTDFAFPVGKAGSGLVPIEISALAGSTANQTFTAEYIHQSAYSLGPILRPDVPQLTQVSGCDYWRLDLKQGSSTYPLNSNANLVGSTTNITLYWNPNNSAGCSSTFVTNLSDLSVAHFNFSDNGPTYQGAWEAPNSSGYVTNGSTSSGSITYAGASIFSPFTLGSTNGLDNPLSLVLDYFTGTKENGYNLLNWKAECNSETASFVLQRSSDGTNFSDIDSVQAATATECSLPYNYNDYTATGSKVYYRLEVIDQNGNITYSQLVLILNDQNVIQLMNVRPNPVQTEAWLNISASENQNVELVIYSIDGKQLVRQTINVVGGMNTIDLHTSTLANGMYIVRGVFMNGQTNTLTFVKQ